MASIDSLPADQRAVLELVLRRGRSYDEIGKLLSIDRAAVRERALSALDAIGPQTQVAPERRALITDYLLGQLPGRVSDDVRDRIAQSPGERAWARVLASELAPLASGPLPELPAASSRREPAASSPSEPRPIEATPAAAATAEATESATQSEYPRQRTPRPERRPSSRRGGALVLGLAVLVVAAVVAVLLVSGGGSSKHKATAAKSSSSSSASSSSSRPVAQINLVPPNGGNAAGIAEVLRQGSTFGIAIVAQGVAPNTKSPPNAYAVWLYNSPTDSHILGFVNPGVSSNGKLQTAGALPTNAAHYKQVLVTLETRSNPTTPGKIVLEGTLTGV